MQAYLLLYRSSFQSCPEESQEENKQVTRQTSNSRATCAVSRFRHLQLRICAVFGGDILHPTAPAALQRDGSISLPAPNSGQASQSKIAAAYITITITISGTTAAPLHLSRHLQHLLTRVLHRHAVSDAGQRILQRRSP
jgi:hypothetical protein